MLIQSSQLKNYRRKSPRVRADRTGNYLYAANFHKPFFAFMANFTWVNQILRFLFTNLMMFFILEQVFTGPIDIWENLAYLNVWAYFFVFTSNLYQFRSSNYEVEKAANTDQTKTYPNSTYYKQLALQSLEVASALNLVLLIGFWFYYFPNANSVFTSSQLQEAFGDNIYVQIYFWTRNIVIHTAPFVVTILNVLQSDIIFMEQDWYLMPTTAIVYLFLNFAVSQYSGKDQVYIINWTYTSTYIQFVPLLLTVGFMMALMSTHFILCIITQVLRQRYEYDFANLP